uniref:VRK serine/threonine kinase 3 n=1 Tax=Takifugu rubripes TaxID=31033 RepID=A0A6D2XRL8_TAKRU
MPFHFCPQCGSKLQPDFKFCPSCGERLPCPDDGPVAAGVATALGLSSPEKDEGAAAKTSRDPGPVPRLTEGKSQTFTALSQVTARSPLQKTRNSLRLAKLGSQATAAPGVPPGVPPGGPARGDQHDDDSVALPSSPSKPNVVTPLLAPGMVASAWPTSPAKRSPRATKGKAKVSSPVVKQVVETRNLSEIDKKASESTVDVSSSPTSLQSPKSPFKGKNKAKKVKYAPAVAPLQEGEELSDTTGRRWTLVKLLSQSATEVIYEVSRSGSKESKHILKLGAKHGRIFNEQNFLQRAAKPASVEKWIKQNKMDFLGIPLCVGFGLHADSYRFLIFSNMGGSLQSFLEEEKKLLSETTVLQLACRIVGVRLCNPESLSTLNAYLDSALFSDQPQLDVLHYIHTNEYVHADVNAENIYIQDGGKTEIFLVGYCHAFRFCPGGKHVEYREDSKTPHEGALEFISLDTHKGAAPSRRSDLQSLAYCMLHWHTGTLPWSGLTHPDKVAAVKQRYMEDVPALLSHCFGKKRVSSALRTYVSAAMALQYAELPDYAALRGGLGEELLQQGGSMEQPLSTCTS